MENALLSLIEPNTMVIAILALKYSRKDCMSNVLEPKIYHSLVMRFTENGDFKTCFELLFIAILNIAICSSKVEALRRLGIQILFFFISTICVDWKKTPFRMAR